MYRKGPGILVIIALIFALKLLSQLPLPAFFTQRRAYVLVSRDNMSLKPSGMRILISLRGFVSPNGSLVVTL